MSRDDLTASTGIVDFGASRPLSDHIDLEPFNASRTVGFLFAGYLKGKIYGYSVT